MSNIYRYMGNEFDKGVIFDKLSDISQQIEEERSKPESEQDKELIFKLINRQFIEGLKLSIGW